MIAWKHSLPGYEWLVHQIWYLEVTADEVIDPKPHLIPNPRAHLLFTPAHQPYSYNNGKAVLSGEGNHLLTASEDLLLLQDTPPLKRIGITFRPEAISVLASDPAIRPNQCLWSTQLQTLFNEDFQSKLWIDTTPDTLLTVISKHLKSINLEQPQDKAYRVAKLATHLMDEEQDLLPDIDAIAAQCACSRRTLERYFKQVTGLSLKKYQQMLRLESVILSLYDKSNEIDWAEFSQQFGFSDQSHLIRTLKQQLHRTPSSYLKQRDLTIDIYGDFES